MKTLITLIAFFLAINSGIADTVTHKFTTSGNCYVCKVRIEEAVNKIEGVESVNWDYNYDVTTVIYDDRITDINTIMKAIALVGHDTEWYKADSAAYAFLIGSCCEYAREIDYSKVQIGYLSLEKIWLSVEDNPLAHIKLYPSLVNDGLINIENIPSGINLNMNIYDITGLQVYSSALSPNNANRKNCSGLSAGNYFVTISDNKNQVFNKRIIIQ